MQNSDKIIQLLKAKTPLFSAFSEERLGEILAGARDKSFVRVRVTGDRELIFGDVLVRVSPDFSLAMHIDTDEANAADVRTGAQCYLDGIQSRY